MEQFAQEGIIIKRLYGTSRTQDGIRLAKSLHFKVVTPTTEQDNLLRFELDLETTTNPFFSEYQRTVKKVLAKNRKVEHSSSQTEKSDKKAIVEVK